MLTLSLLTILGAAFMCIAGTYVFIKVPVKISFTQGSAELVISVAHRGCLCIGVDCKAVHLLMHTPESDQYGHGYRLDLSPKYDNWTLCIKLTNNIKYFHKDDMTIPRRNIFNFILLEFLKKKNFEHRVSHTKHLIESLLTCEQTFLYRSTHQYCTRRARLVKSDVECSYSSDGSLRCRPLEEAPSRRSSIGLMWDCNVSLVMYQGRLYPASTAQIILSHSGLPCRRTF